MHVLTKNEFGTLVIQRQSICSGMKAIGVCRLGAGPSPMDHEGCVCCSLAVLGAQVSNYPAGLDRSYVVQRKLYREGPEEVVQANAVTDCSASGLKQHVKMRDAIIGRNRKRIKDFFGRLSDPCNRRKAQRLLCRAD